MAEVIVKRIEMLVNYGTYNAGDVIEVYAETDDLVLNPYPLVFEGTGIIVYVNGVPVVTGEILIQPPNQPPILSEQKFNPLICVGDALVKWSDPVFFPYVVYYTEANHFSCVINPPTCDLIVNGIPTVTPASSESSTDGAISITGQSSLNWQAKLGDDFTYDDGTGENPSAGSVEFTGLLPGDYRIFLRDEANCAVNILVTVGVDNSYGVIYRSEFDDLNGWETRVDIVKRGHVGVVSEVTGNGLPIELCLRGEGSLDKFEPVQSLQGKIGLISKVNNQYLDLYTNDRNLFRIHYYKNTGSGLEQKCTLKVLPQQYGEVYAAPPTYATIIATDGLSELSNLYLIQGDGQKYYGTISLIKLIAFCLEKIKTELPIRVACNLYAEDMDQADDDDPFAQAYIDFECFYIAEQNPTLDFVLRSILEPFGCVIKQWDNRWNIIRVEESHAAYDYRDFDKDGEYLGNGTFDPVIDIKFPSQGAPGVKAVDRDHNLEMRPGYGQMEVRYSLGLKPNIIDNGDFRYKSTYVAGYGYLFTLNTDGFTIVSAGYPLSQSSEQIDNSNVALVLTSSAMTAYNSGNGGDAYIQTKAYSLKMGTNNQVRLNFRYKLTSTAHQFGSEVFSINVPYTKVRIEVLYGSLYLQADGSWGSAQNAIYVFVTKYGEYIESEFTAKQPTTGTPVTGMDFSIRFYQPFGYYFEFDDLSTFKARQTYDSGANATVLPGGYLAELLNTTAFAPADVILYYRLDADTSPDDDYFIVRPDDYHATDNPRQWILYSKTFPQGGFLETFTVYIDRIKAIFLTDGADPIDTIIRKINGEPNNPDVLEKSVIIGSYSVTVVTETEFSIAIGLFFPAGSSLTLTTRNILSAELIYTGWLRDLNGVGYEYWKRDGIEERDKLHGIMLRQYSGQYKKSWRLLRGSYKHTTKFIGMLNVLRETNDSNRIYLPIALTLNDKRTTFSTELLELRNVFTGGGSDESTESPYTSAFTSGFGSASFN